MDVCPLEIQILIFEFACTDGGSAGRSLALVSRAVRQLSYPFHWNSLSIHGYEQASAFAKLLYSQPPIPGPPPRPILHLFVSSRPTSLAFDYIWLEMPTIWPGVLRSILRYASPTLKTLAIISLEAPVHSATILSPALHIHYTCLVELTIRGRCTPDQLHPAERGDEALLHSGVAVVPDGQASDAIWPSIPSLRRLHLACAFNGLERSTRAEHTLIHELGPSLTHLRLSVLDLWGSKRIAEIVHSECAERGIVDLSIEVGPATAYSGSRSFPAAYRSNPGPHGPEAFLRKAVPVKWDRILPPSPALEVFALQPPPVEITDFYCSCCMDVRGDRDVMRVFEALTHASDGRFLYLPRRTKTVYGIEEANMDWLDRVKGLQGCWAARQEEPGRRAAGDAAVAPVQEPVLDQGASGRRKRVSLKSVVKQLQKAKFW